MAISGYYPCPSVFIGGYNSEREEGNMNPKAENKDTDRPPQSFPSKQETHEIIACAFDVLNELGHGLHEKCYENALAVEFGLRNISYAQQEQFEVQYKGVRVGLYIPDLMAFDQVLVDAKVIDQITDQFLRVFVGG
jgi:GxxExxY protein